MTSINQHILDYANVEVERIRDLNAKLVGALHAVVRAETLEGAQEIASAAIAIAIVGETNGTPG